MNKRIINFDLNGKIVLGFDTGLNAQAFAQAKMAAVITSPGSIVYPDGKIETWQSEGVSEHTGTMAIWGPLFPGTELSEIINDSRSKDDALDAVRYWLRASIALEEHSAGKEAPYPGPSGALVVTSKCAYPLGTVFFPPARLIKRTLDADGTGAVMEAERWVHPDLTGQDSISFCAGAMLYKVFSGASPFAVNHEAGSAGQKKAPAKAAAHNTPEDELRMDLREGVFTPPHLASPGLDSELSKLLSHAMSSVPQNKEEKLRPNPEQISGFIGLPSSRPVSSWIKPLSEEELAKTHTELEQYSKKKALSVKTRRFVIRNTAIIAGAAIALIALALIIRGSIKHRAELPTTRGMNPVEVADTYYGAFGTLDHTLMEACVSGKAGKGDIDTVINLFVISRVRQAYEINQNSFMSAEEWTEAGRPLTESTVFGVTDLNLKIIRANNEKTLIEAEYILWMPGSQLRDPDEQAGATAGEETVILPPGGLASRDVLELTLLKGDWRITNIERTSERLVSGQ